MARLFGTDGVRGLVNKEITAELALALGSAAAGVLQSRAAEEGRRPKAIIGRDPRLSGDFLNAAISAGITSAGVDVTDLGILPTPALAFLAGSEGADLAVMVSASHNAMPDNGIKFFGPGGYKLDDEVEDAVEVALSGPRLRPLGADVGRINVDSGGAIDDYIDHVLASNDVDLTGLRIAVDSANGAASEIGPRVLREAGADVVVINSSPDGRNINDQCGSTHPEQLQAVTVASEAHFGVAFDGDADRCLAVDHTGALIDGDMIMGVLALAMQEQGRLGANTLVVTVMTNLGLLLAMKQAGIRTIQTDVGDRYVLEAMRTGGFNLGGEQSGHIILGDYSTTGDGTLTALHLAAQVQQAGVPLAEMVKKFPQLPQVLLNVAGVDKTKTHSSPVLAQAVAQSEQRLGESGRVLLRASGTEPLVRVMVEAATVDQAEIEAQKIADVVVKELSL
ncbi:MAG TPA: phosphoglucosamine mutase [Beutenbergiaceae bacterium]|nr:phosphoglucosamine mutase [Beutenbergiaceae bacterium]